MAKNKQKELQELEKVAAKLARKKKRIEAQLEEEKETAKWYDQVMKESGFKRPRDFIKALMDHFGIRTVSLVANQRGPGRPPKAEIEGKRKRTKITSGVRDKVKGMLKKGTAKNSVSKQLGISYPVIKKIESGAYDKL